MQTQPKNAQALHLLGIIAHQVGRAEQGLQMIRQAIEINPRVALFHSNLGEMSRLLGQCDEAIQHGEKAVSLDPSSATALSNLGVAYYDKGNLEKAEFYQKKALSIQPGLVPALNNMGSICRDKKDKEGALVYYRKALAADPEYLESLNNLGAVLNESEQPEDAIKVLLTALRLKPDYAEAHGNIAGAFLCLEQLDKALAGFNRAITLKKDNVEAHIGLARVWQEKGNLIEAERVAEHALALAPEKPEVHTTLGGIYTESGFPEKAAGSYARALALEPDRSSALLGKGNLLMEMGKLGEAEASFRRVLEVDPRNLGARLSLAQVTKAIPGEANLVALVEEECSGTLSETKALPLNFALGKCYDDIKEYDLAFKHYQEGCRLKRKRIQYSAESNDSLVENICKVFNSEMVGQLHGGGCLSDVPIFVMGMPRSGTTLTEQIIASHPTVHGAGELPDLLQVASTGANPDASGYPLSLLGLTQAEYRMLGEKYVTQLRERNPMAPHITDKMPANFNLLGFIYLALPNAKIIHVKRNPVDTCLSAYTRLFSRSQYQSYDLTELGRYYRNYAKLMDHWREVLPVGSFYEVQYEELVADIGTQARALIGYCGLEWDDACLDFHKNERSIRTASVTQVRQPIYNTSVERWRKYESHLGPLLEALGDLVQAQH